MTRKIFTAALALTALVGVTACETPQLSDPNDPNARTKDSAVAGAALARLLHRLHRNTRGGSRRNILAHYDLGNGLFERFPCDEVYGMHNWPQLGFGEMAVGSGPMMAASDLIKIEIEGVGAHAAMPHRGVDPVYVASQVIGALQSLVSRSTNPADAAVVSITKVEAGTAANVIPRTATLTGTCRSFRAETRDRLEAGIQRIAVGVAEALGATARVTYSRGYPPTVNHPDQTAFAREVAAGMLGEDAVVVDPEPSMGGEDFAFMLEQVPGTYVWLGTGGEFDLHHPRYDFNDAALPLGASYWVELVESRLGERTA